ncbi:hypothetical protein LIER_33952 [Lithospermum erythrorhizon]|uniref:HMA domain-containing protein n=1 Tax=Lithospermum erythrorhizon TaxID=34254 RepID=A0AAV3S1T6_LITER
MKSIELFCASPSSTAICSSMEQYSMVRHGMKQLDRHTHGLGDRLKTRTPPCLSERPFNPRPSFHQKSRKSSSRPNEIRRKSSADISNLRHNSPSTSSRYLLSDEKSMFQSSSVDAEISSDLVVYKPKSKVNNCKELEVFRSSSARSSNESPVYKLSSSTTLARSSHESSMRTNNNTTTLARLSHESPVYKSSSAKSNNDMQLHKSSSTSTRNQVVELRVSIHCKGCEGKVRKHLSKMEGVTSCNIDLVSKKVTVVGNVTPLSVRA